MGGKSSNFMGEKITYSIKRKNTNDAFQAKKGEN